MSEADRTAVQNAKALLDKQKPLEGKVLDELISTGMKFAKYEYHQAAGILRDGDDRLITTEGFAPESHQFTVEPFTLHGAIGDYKGTAEANPYAPGVYTVEGMKRYYLHDDPFTSHEDVRKSALKDKMLSFQG